MVPLAEPNEPRTLEIIRCRTSKVIDVWVGSSDQEPTDGTSVPASVRVAAVVESAMVSPIDDAYFAT
jgi:hypothetical protein